MGWRLSGIGLRWRLIALVLLAVVPALGLIIYSSAEDRDRAREQAEQQLRLLQDTSNQNITAEVSRAATIVQTMTSVLATLGTRLGPGAPPELCTDLLAGLSTQTEEFAQFWVALPDGKVQCSAKPVIGGDVSRVDAVVTAKATRQIALGGYTVDPLGGKPVAYLVAPILSGDSLVALVAIAFDFEFINANADLGDSPRDSQMWVVDAEGRILLQVPSSGVAPGTALADETLRGLVQRQAPPGNAKLEAPDGTRLYAFGPLNVPDSARPYVIVSRSSDAVLADANFARNRNIVGLLAVAALAIAAASLADLFLTRRVGQLERGTRAVAAGDLSVRVSEGGIREFDGLARSFNEMTAELSLGRRTMQEKEAQFRAVFEAAADGLTINDPETRLIVEANPALGQLMGVPREELLGADPAAFLDQADLQAYGEALAQARGGAYRQRAHLVRRDGTGFVADLAGTPVQFGGRRHVLTVIRDVTDQVETERILEQRVAVRTKELSTLLRAAEAANSTLELGELVHAVLGQLVQVIPGAAMSVEVREGASGLRIMETIAGVDGVFGDSARGLQVQMPAGYYETLEQRGRPLMIDDVLGPDDEFAREHVKVLAVTFIEKCG